MPSSRWHDAHWLLKTSLPRGIPVRAEGPLIGRDDVLTPGLCAEEPGHTRADRSVGVGLEQIESGRLDVRAADRPPLDGIEERDDPGRARK